MAVESKCSYDILANLAQSVGQLPPSRNEYVDQSLSILGQAIQVRDVEKEQEFLRQRQFIALESHSADERMNGQFRELGKLIEEGFQLVEARFSRVDERSHRLEQRFEERFEEADREIRSLKIQLDNAAAIQKNSRLRRMHQLINPIKVLKPSPNTNEYTWTIPRSMPKHMKNLYNLYQHAQGTFEGSWEGKTKQEKSEAKRKAVERIKDLTDFYQVTVFSDEASESDATEVMFEVLNLDEYMESLLAEWGIEWEMVRKLGQQHMHSQPQQIGVKRGGDLSLVGQKNSRGSEGDSQGDRRNQRKYPVRS